MLDLPRVPKPVTRQAHGLIDYAYVSAVALAPELVGFEDDAPQATNLAALIAGGALVTTLMTRAEWGLVGVVPYRAHLKADVAVSVLALASPWLLGFADKPAARNTLLAIGAFGLAAVALSQTDEMPAR